MMRNIPRRSGYTLFDLSRTHYVDIQILTDRNIELLYSEIKKECYNNKTYKWSIKQATYYTSIDTVNKEIFIKSITEIFNRYFQLNPHKPKTSAIEFILNLNKSPKFSEKKYSVDGIGLIQNIDILDFLEQVEKLREFTTISGKQMIYFINRNFNTSYTDETLLNYYYKNKENKKSKK